MRYLLLFSLIFACSSFSDDLTVNFINVGKGDCILIQTPNNKNILIDGGLPLAGDDVVKYIKDRKISKIDIIVLTHPHIDHCGGLFDVIANFKIDKFYMPVNNCDLKNCNEVVNLSQAKGIPLKYIMARDSIFVDPALQIDIFAPNNEYYKDCNNSSIVLKLTFNKISFLFTADAEWISEYEMLKKKYDLKADVYKVPHHGTDELNKKFFKKVSPRYAVITNNDTLVCTTVLKELRKRNVAIFTTVSSSVIFTSNGKTINVKAIQ